ncbi:MAG: hypothetical protein HY676_03030 [Chloroflexi bacterium]|nr:hypothetical protein [Chloroflexota bacterium]
MTSLTFYGGVGEVGGNKVLIEDAETRLFLDFGISFHRMGDFYEEFLQPRTNNALRDQLRLGIVPRVDGIYRSDLLKVEGIDEVLKEHGMGDSSLWETNVKSYDEIIRERDGKPFVDAVLLSHTHEDHFKHISLLDEKIPIFCTEITKATIEVAEDLGRGGFEYEFTAAKGKSLKRTGKTAFFPGAFDLTSGEPRPRQFNTLAGPISIGNILVEAIPVDHSVPGGASFLLSLSDGQRVLYTGDLRFHGRRNDYTEGFWKKVRNLRPNILITEGTRIDDDAPDSELNVEEGCRKLVSSSAGLVMVGFAWKDTTRYQTLKTVAEQTGRTLVISPKLAYLLNKLKDFPESGITDVLSEKSVRVYLERKESMLYSKQDYVSNKYAIGFSTKWSRGDASTIRTEHYDRGVRAYEIRQNPTQYIVHMDFFDFNELIDLEPPSGSVFIGARSEPFNEEMKLDEARLKRWLERFHINAPHHEPIYIHASGHASGPELIQMIKDIHPQVVLPIHTEKPQIFGEKLAGTGIEVRIPELGREIKL